MSSPVSSEKSESSRLPTCVSAPPSLRRWRTRSSQPACSRPSYLHLTDSFWSAFDLPKASSRRVRAGFAGVSLPRKCDRPRQPNEAQCPLDPYMILPEKCKYIDQQQWKLQEPPEMVPTGEMPRSVLCSVDRRLVDAAIPGNRVTITGIMAVMTHQNKGADTKVALRTPYLQVLGLKHGFEQRSSEGDSLTTFSEEEAEAFVELSRDPTIFERVCKSIAPAIFGSADGEWSSPCAPSPWSEKKTRPWSKSIGLIQGCWLRCAPVDG